MVCLQQSESCHCKGKQGKLKKKMGFADVASKKIEIRIDDTVFHKLQWISKKTVLTRDIYAKDKNGKFKLKDEQREKVERGEKEIPARWQAYLLQTKQYIEVSKETLRKYVTPKFMEFVK